MLSLVTLGSAGFSPVPRPAGERTLSAYRGYASTYWKDSDYAFVRPDSMGVDEAAVEDFVARFEAAEYQPRSQAATAAPSKARTGTRVPGWNVAGASGRTAQPDYGKIAAAAAMTGLALAYTGDVYPTDMFDGCFQHVAGTSSSRAALSSAKAAIPDYGSIAAACAASATPGFGKMADALRKGQLA